MGIRAQIILVWWCLGFTMVNLVCWIFLFNMVPPPDATWTAQQVADFYREHSQPIRVGAMLTSWTSAFLVPLIVVISIQIARLEKGTPVWAITQFAGGTLMTIFLVLPPLFWGIAAFSPERPAEITMLMHETAMLTLVTTAQYYIFNFVALGVAALAIKGDEFWPFPRWYGYATLWAAFFLEAGAPAFLTKTGPFSWNGLFAFWFPLGLFFPWILMTCWLLLRALKRQQAAGIGQS
jgi:hypothetical protein